MNKVEYFVLRLPNGHNSDTIDTFLNKLAETGWKLSHILNEGNGEIYFIMERESLRT